MILLVIAIVHLMMLRHKAGDIYPPYSSLRSDPLGIKIFYESLNGIRHLSVSRNYKPLKKISSSSQFTFFYFGVYHNYILWSDEIYKSIEEMVQKGNRVVISFFPVTEEIKSENDEGHASDTDFTSSSGDSSDKSSDNQKTRTFSEKFGFTIDFQMVSTGADAICVICEQGQQSLPRSVLMPTSLYFANPDSSWRVIYTRLDKPVIMERVMGKGSLVLCADSFFLSNEAMFQYRYTGLLAWLIGRQKEVIFDEQHHGIEETQGIATLAKKYRLHGLFAGFIILAGLFMWKNAFPLIPRRDTVSEAEISMQQESINGLIHLLTRNIPPNDILQVCFHEWKKSSAILPTLQQSQPLEVQRIIEDARFNDEQSLLKTYKHISQVLAERKFQWKKQ
jgi:hypothetical protein